MEIEYKQATLEDIEIILDQRIIFSNELLGKQDARTEAHLRESVAPYFKEELNKTYLCWYAMINGEVASIAGLVIRKQPGNLKNPSGIWGYIMSVYTAQQYRRKGLSANVLEKLMETAREMGVNSFELHATKDGEPVYIKNGFEIHDEPTYRKYVE